MSKQTYRVCLCFRRRFRLKEAEVPEDVQAVFEKYSENGVMNLDHFYEFLKKEQGEDKLTRAEAESLMESFLKEHYKHLKFFQRRSLYIKEFFEYLLSGINAPLPYPPKVHHDMGAPLSHYFIYTGHNSYLTGNQISSDCSEKPIVDALKRGVRVIELDMWPNSSKDDVDIRHGGTLTPPVKIIKCLKAIKENAFVASKYPVIITLEDHLTQDLQAKVAKMMSETFGNILVPRSECYLEFPSPESLKNRIIISTKPPKEYLETEMLQEENGGSTTKGRKSSEERAREKENPTLVMKVDIEDGDYQEEDDRDQENAPTEYKHMIAIRAEKMKGGIIEWLRVNSPGVHRVSLNEEKLEKAVVTHGTEIIRFNQRNLMRVYPKGTRIDSSNYNPFVGWMHGAQMVAFNMQGRARPLWLMQGMFRANGGCGYVKKPDFLLRLGPNNEVVFDPNRRLPVQKTLKVKIYMGQGWNLEFHRTHFDLYSPPDFYVKVGIVGVPFDSDMRNTKAIEDNWTPVWNEEFSFPLTLPELALLRIEVREFDTSDKDDFGGQTCLPVSELKTGIRAIPLCNHRGDMYKSVKLLMRFDFT
ncbi:Phosphoinositide-specific phospholipase C [Handroanthus impetiginosus]|uniref:Phosphoinositide phospholipase C n=1 Tax=Handroanthus impetiginosus TaxID=429701 RepID=A0A2G9HI50_9LAMI|nr:Phosphoinositide-specific phospholipase C [Handroanthus impetiginosus]